MLDILDDDELELDDDDLDEEEEMVEGLGLI